MGFRDARLNRGLTQAQAADFLGVDQSAVHLWENGKNNPKAALLPKIAALYGVSIEELLKGNHKAAKSAVKKPE